MIFIPCHKHIMFETFDSNNVSDDMLYASNEFIVDRNDKVFFLSINEEKNKWYYFQNRARWYIIVDYQNFSEILYLSITTDFYDYYKIKVKNL